MSKRETNKTDQINSFLVGGSAVIGVGIGFLTGYLVACATIGVGVGLVLAAIVKAFGK